MDLSILRSSSSSFSTTSPSLSLTQLPLPSNSHKFILFPFLPNFNPKSRKTPTKSLFWRQNLSLRPQTSNHDGFILEDVPHLTNFLPDLPVISSLQFFFQLYNLWFLPCFYFIYFFSSVISKSIAEEPSICYCQANFCGAGRCGCTQCNH